MQKSTYEDLEKKIKELELKCSEFKKNEKKLYAQISQHKLTENSLRKTKAHLHPLHETTPDLIWLKDPNGVYISCNK